MALGFIESAELLDLRTAIVLEYSIDQERAAELKAIYQVEAGKIIDNLGPDPRRHSEAQIGIGLMCASMKLRAGLIMGYNYELVDVLEQVDQHTYAYTRGDDTLIEQIESMLIRK